MMSLLAKILFALIVVHVLDVSPASCQLDGPMTCSTTGSSCSAFLYYTLNNSDTLDYLSSLFSVSQGAIMQESTYQDTNGVLISVQCLCSESLRYQAEAAYRVNPGDTPLSIVEGVYRHLGHISTNERSLTSGQIVDVSLYCGCTYSLAQPLLTYVVQSADNLESLAIRFNTSTTQISRLNNGTVEGGLTKGKVVYVPIHDSALKAVVDLPYAFTGRKTAGRGVRMALGAVVGTVLAGLLLIAAGAAVVFCLQTKRLFCYKNYTSNSDTWSPGSSRHDIRVSAVNSISRRESKAVPWGLHHVSSSLSRDTMNSVFGMDRPIAFGYDEIVAATMCFKESNKIGAGSHSSVYYGVLRDQEVAIKKMKAATTKDVSTELKRICMVHHANMVVLIGYTLQDDDLFLVYDYAKNGAVSDRLHNPHLKGFTPLTWNARVQIALDTARGLEYIHERTKGHYVHLDVKSSNLLLDSSLRAKVADFGIARLINGSQEDGALVTRTFGNCGYLAPECVRDGQATTRSDVYAFGVVLFELITGEGPILKGTKSRPDRRSLISLMLSALDDVSNNGTMLKTIVDPYLQVYSVDSVLKVAALGRRCVEEDPHDRPDMKNVVQNLSQILLSCIAWDTARSSRRQLG